MIPRLGSDRDGERLACLRAIDSQLEKASLTSTDLAERLSETPQAEGGREAVAVSSTWPAALRWIVNQPNWTPRPHERRFVHEMQERIGRTTPTPKQANWIAGIVERLGGRLEVVR